MPHDLRIETYDGPRDGLRPLFDDPGRDRGRGHRNLRFYQRQGFRMRSVERDAFTPATGYPPGLLINGIELRDRVWLDRAVRAEPPGPA